MDIYQVSILIAIIFAIVEVLTSSLIFLGMSAGVLVVALIQYIYGDFSWSREILLFTVASFTATILLRKCFKKITDQTELAGDDINQY